MDYNAIEITMFRYGIAADANNYTHPDDANTRHVTDEQVTAWNAKASTALVSKANHGLMSAIDKVRFDLCASVHSYGTVDANGARVSGSKNWDSGRIGSGQGQYKVTRYTSGKTITLVTGRDGAYASILEDTNSYFTVHTADDASPNDASFNFITFNLPDIL